MREMLPDPQKDSYNFIKGIYNILNQSFEEIKIDNHNNFQKAMMNLYIYFYVLLIFIVIVKVLFTQLKQILLMVKNVIE